MNVVTEHYKLVALTGQQIFDNPTLNKGNYFVHEML